LWRFVWDDALQYSPERARRFLEQGPGRGARLLAERPEAARARGGIEGRDCLAAANLFIGMVRGNLYLDERVIFDRFFRCISPVFRGQPSDPD
jgi:hypothetical protein